MYSQYFKIFQFLNCLVADRDIYFSETASNIIIIIIIIIIICFNANGLSTGGSGYNAYT